MLQVVREHRCVVFCVTWVSTELQARPAPHTSHVCHDVRDLSYVSVFSFAGGERWP